MDYTETFNPIVKVPTVRVLFSLLVTFEWDIQRVDVNNTFLNGDMQEAIFMIQLEGFVSS